jgi:hypothetical protein
MCGQQALLNGKRVPCRYGNSPPQYSLRQLKSQAKDLRRAAVALDADALLRLRTHHPRHETSGDADLSALSL